MATLCQCLLDKLDRAGFWDVRVWDFGFRSLFREYAWFFFLKAVIAHPMKARRGLRLYRQFVRGQKQPAPEYTRFLYAPDEAIFLQRVLARTSRPLVGLGFCLKPINPEDPSQSCPSGRANHDCLCFERGEARPICAECAIREIGSLALETGCPVYIMTSAKDIARDFMLPQISRGSFPTAILILCPYSVQAIILPLLICGVEMLLLSYGSGSCADYEQWLNADRGVKDERTTIDAESQLKLDGVLKRLQDIKDKEVGGIPSRRNRRFRQSGNIFYPAGYHPQRRVKR